MGWDEKDEEGVGIEICGWWVWWWVLVVTIMFAATMVATHAVGSRFGVERMVSR